MQFWVLDLLACPWLGICYGYSLPLTHTRVINFFLISIWIVSTASNYQESMAYIRTLALNPQFCGCFVKTRHVSSPFTYILSFMEAIGASSYLMRLFQFFFVVTALISSWKLHLQHGSKESHICVDIYDEVGVGGGASGVAGGLLHPYSPKVKLLWQGAEFWNENLNLLSIAEGALNKLGTLEHNGESPSRIVRRRGILRPVVNLKNMSIMTENAQNCLASCRIEPIHEDAAQNLVPNLSVPLNMAFYMPEALNINAQSYLQGLYLACQNLAMANSDSVCRELSFHQKRVQSLQELAGDYDAVIICLGARSAFLPELYGKVPLRTCRGVIAHLQLGDDMREKYPEDGPSILSDAWLAVHGGRNIDLGSTWEWNSRNYSREVTAEEASKAMEVLLPKATSVYPAIRNWNLTTSVGGLRAMPPVTQDGSLPLLGCVDEYVVDRAHSCKYWLFTGLGARGLLFHAWLGKLLALAVLSTDENLLPSQVTSWKCQL